MEKFNHVLIGLSGGIDSTVAAFLLKEKGFQVTGLYLHLIDEPESLASSNNRYRAQKIAQKLNIPFYEIDYRKEFYRTIIADFIRQYRKGLTPNPCIYCNEKVKFKLLYDFALKEGFTHIATGHYVRVEKNEKEGRYLLKRGIDEKKEQSYFLYRIKESILSKCIFPLGGLRKEDVKRIALKMNLADYAERDSQEICFIPGNDYRKLLVKQGKIREEEGYFFDSAGNVLGKHKGISFYTVGQRRKTGLSLNSRKYVLKISAQDNSVIIGDESELYKQEFEVTALSFISPNPITKPARLLVQIRYNTPPARAVVYPYDEKKMKITFDVAQRAITPGQSAVFYDKDIVLGGGIITQCETRDE